VRLQGMLEGLAEVTGDPGQVGAMADSHRVEELRRLEEIKAAAAAAQARVTVAFEASQLARQEAAGVRREQRGRGIGDQVALARGVPASQGSRHLGFAKAMAEMPHTLALLTAGRIDERTATLLVRETAALSLTDRTLVDHGSARCGSTPPPDWSTTRGSWRRPRGGSRERPGRFPPSSTLRPRSAAPPASHPRCDCGPLAFRACPTLP